MSDASHAAAEARSLELHRLVAERLRDDPALLDAARARVAAWLREGTVARRWAAAWAEVLSQPLSEVIRFLVDPKQGARDLRQSSPFAGVLSPGAMAGAATAARVRGSAMNRQQLEHVIRAAATIAGDDEIVVIGSQSILGCHPEAPAELCVSADVDLYPRNHPERADLVEGSIGELSPLHETFGYYAQAVGPATAVLPRGWEDRLVAVPTPAGTGLCLEPHDLAISKYVAGRPKDHEYLRTAIRHGLLRREVLLGRLDSTAIEKVERDRLRQAIERDFTEHLSRA